MTDKIFPQQQYFSAEDCQTLYPPGTPYGNDHPNGWQDMADRLNALLASRLQASAVVVPELTRRQSTDIANEAQMITGRSIWPSTVEAIAKVMRLRAIPADRVLGDGMVAVDREEWAATQDLLAQARCAAHAVEDEGQCDMTGICRAVFACDSLRANQGGAAT